MHAGQAGSADPEVTSYLSGEPADALACSGRGSAYAVRPSTQHANGDQCLALPRGQCSLDTSVDQSFSLGVFADDSEKHSGGMVDVVSWEGVDKAQRSLDEEPFERRGFRCDVFIEHVDCQPCAWADQHAE